MLQQIILYAITLIGIICFILFYKSCKPYLSILSEIFGIVAIISLINAVIEFLLGIEIGLYLIVVSTLLMIRNLVLASLGLYLFIDKLGNNVLPFFIKKENKRNINLSNYLSTGLITYIICLLLAVLFLYLSGHNIIRIKTITRLSEFLSFVVNVFLMSFMEETLFRLFLLGLLTYFFREIKYKTVMSSLLTSLIWAIQHFGKNSSENVFCPIKFFYIILVGIVLSYLMFKRGLESCISVHFLHNLTVIMLFGNMC